MSHFSKHKNIFWFVLSFVLTLFFIRGILLLFKGAHDINNLESYNIHHFLIGAFLLIVVIIVWLCTAINTPTVILAGIGSALVGDEIVYFVVLTQGSYELYMGPASLWGAVIMAGIVLLITGAGYYTTKKR